MREYTRPVIYTNTDIAEGIYAASGSTGNADDGDCLNVTWWEDNPDGDVYRWVFKVTHKGHQSYGQTVVAQMSVPVTVVETDGTVHSSVDGTTLTLVRDNQLNDNGLVELWVKMRADAHPSVISAVAKDCIRH